jgi:hypothetical protein
MLTVVAGVRCRYLRICYQHEHDDTLRISLDRDFTMVDEPAMGQSGTGWRWNDDIFAAQGKARHVFPYLLRKNHLTDPLTHHTRFVATAQLLGTIYANALHDIMHADIRCWSSNYGTIGRCQRGSTSYCKTGS